MRCLCYVTCFHRKIIAVPFVKTVLFWLDILTLADLICLYILGMNIRKSPAKLHLTRLICDRLCNFAYKLL